VRILASALVFLSFSSVLALSGLILQTEACAKDKTAKLEKKSEPKRPMDSKPDSKPSANSKTFIFTQTGGFMAINKKYEKQLSNLHTDERNELEKLIDQSGLASVKDEKHLTAGAADVFYYDFWLKEGKIEHHAMFDDVSLPDSYRPLVNYLKPKTENQKRP
jgi:hypothetical protein